METSNVILFSCAKNLFPETDSSKKFRAWWSVCADRLISHLMASRVFLPCLKLIVHFINTLLALVPFPFYSMIDKSSCYVILKAGISLATSRFRKIRLKSLCSFRQHQTCISYRVQSLGKGRKKKNEKKREGKSEEKP